MRTGSQSIALQMHNVWRAVCYDRMEDTFQLTLRQVLMRPFTRWNSIRTR